MPMETFGTRMVFLRKNSEDPQTQGPLTQSRLADLLNDYDHTLLFSKTQISNWEKGRRNIPLHQRSLLVGLIYVFTTCGGLSEKEAADAFLQSGGYAPLTDAEIKQLPEKALYENRQTNQNGLAASKNSDPCLFGVGRWHCLGSRRRGEQGHVLPC